jgi:hypothetical protein
MSTHLRRQRAAPLLALALGLFTLHPTTSAGQTTAAAQPAVSQQPAPTTRAEALRQEREAKKRTEKLYQRNGFESAMHFVEEEAIFFLTREGFYPKLGSLTTGSGFAAGVGYRNSSIFKRYGIFDLYTAGSMKKYWALEGSATFPRLADGKLYARVYGGRRDYPEEDFFGLGPDSQRNDQVSFALITNRFGGNVGVRPVEPLLVGGGVELLQPHVGRGKDKLVPTIGDVFDDSTAPGLSAQPDFLRTSAFVEVNYSEPVYARKGGWYRAEFSHIADRDLDRYTYNRVDVDLRQFIPFFAERRVIALRAFASTSDASDGNEVPFYLQPYLGGNDTMRGFREYRFRGPHSILFQGEYRFEIWSGLDMAFFYDTGKVAFRREDLGINDLEKDYGFGFRFNTREGVVVRVDAGFGSRDGKHLYITFGGVF